MKIQIKKLPNAKDLPLPAYETHGSVGMDLRAAIEGEVIIEPGTISLISCGVAIAVPVGFEAQIRPRSGLAATHSLIIPNSPGTIDSDYRGEVKVLLLNSGHKPFTVKRGMRIAQMVIAPVGRAEWHEVECLPETARSDGGYGHTGT